jgi:hypothetical protein
MSASKICINFRATSGFVTDGADQTYCLGEAYPTTRAGWAFGITSTPGGSAGTADRNSGVDPRLAGINYDTAQGNIWVFRIDLPAPGNYNIRLALGDDAVGFDQNKITVKDNASTILTVGPHTTHAGSFYDASGVEYSAANWPSNNTPVIVTFASTICIVEIGSPTDFATIACFEVEQLSAPSTGKPTLYYAQLARQ